MANILKSSAIGRRLDDKFDRVRRNYYSLCAAATVAAMNVTPTLCAPTMKSIFDAMMEILFQIAFYVGAVIVVIGVWNWISSMRDENADGQSRAIKQCVVGIAMVSLKALLNPLLSSLTY